MTEVMNVFCSFCKKEITKENLIYSMSMAEHLNLDHHRNYFLNKRDNYYLCDECKVSINSYLRKLTKTKNHGK